MWHVMMVNYGLALDRVLSLVSQMDLDFVHCYWCHLCRASATSLAMVRCHSLSFVGCCCDCLCCYCDDWNSTNSGFRCCSAVSRIRSTWMRDGCDGSCSYQRYVSIVANDSVDDVDCELFLFWYFLCVKNNVASCVYFFFFRFFFRVRKVKIHAKNICAINNKNEQTMIRVQK